jgi:hypothetical protein
MAGGLTTAVDVTRLLERLADRLARAGAGHPVAAAVAMACRGDTGRDIDSFAAWAGLPRAVVAACEAGEVEFGDLPDEIVEHHGGIDLLAMADLDHEYAMRPRGNVR